jgi:hypothetical protein
VTSNELWGAVFLALGAFQAWRIYSSVNSGRWIISYLVDVSVDRRAHPISFWAGVTWEVFAMTIILFLGIYVVAPWILSILVK